MHVILIYVCQSRHHEACFYPGIFYLADLASCFNRSGSLEAFICVGSVWYAGTNGRHFSARYYKVRLVFPNSDDEKTSFSVEISCNVV